MAELLSSADAAALIGPEQDPSRRSSSQAACLEANSLEQMLEALERDPVRTDREVQLHLVPPPGHDFDGRHATIRLYSARAELVQETRALVQGDRVLINATPDDYSIEAQVEGFSSAPQALAEAAFAPDARIWVACQVK